MAKNENAAIKWLLIIAAVVLLVFICWKAGWILTGNKNQVSEQEKQEAIQETKEELQEGLQELNEELQEVQDELRDAFK